MNPQFFRVLRVWSSVVLASLVSSNLLAAEPAKSESKKTAELITYSAPQGEAYFALALRAEGLPPSAQPTHDYVILVDTSASQTGEYRAQTLKLVNELIAALPANDRVSLTVIDVQTQELTKGFIAPSSDGMQTALDRLEKRVPLGATNLEVGLKTVLKSFQGKAARGIIYVGDGMSTANLIHPDNLRKLVEQLRKEHVPLHSYVVGPKTDLQLLGVLAQQTGGMVIIAGAGAGADAARQDGRALAAAAAAPVLYPTETQIEPPLDNLLPRTMLPLRADRETIVLGRGKAPLPASVKVTVKGLVEGSPKTLTWKVSPEPNQDGNTFLGSLWEQANRDQGLNVPLAGLAMLRLARDVFDSQITQMVEFGNESLDHGDIKEVEKIVRGIRQLDPTNAAAQKLMQATRKQSKPKPADRQVAARLRKAQENAVTDAENAAPATDEPTPPPAVGDTEPADDRGDVPEPKPPRQPPRPPAAVDGSTPRPAAPKPGSLLDSLAEESSEVALPSEGTELQRLENLRVIRAERFAAEVGRGIKEARDMADLEPDQALARLKGLINSVNAASDLEPEVRDQLRKRLELVRMEITTRREKIDAEQIYQMQRLALYESQARIVDQIRVDDATMEQLIDRVRALMIEGVRGNFDAYEQAEAVSRVAVSLRPGTGVPAAALFGAEAAGQLDKIFRLRSLRADKLLEALYLTELAHVPFPDEPPIVYPPAEWWQSMTERRKKWASIDLRTEKPAEAKIRKALDMNTSVEFVDTALREALSILKDYHNIEILIDNQAFTEDGITDDTPVTLNVADISLKSVLKLMLEPLQLTYVIQDEVMKITTQTKAQTIRTTRVYPVGDLVIPIRNMGGMMGGMGGMGGGMMGGMGGGMGMGGMGGGMGMMGGGGFFNIAPEKIPDVKAAPQQDAKPAQPAGGINRLSENVRSVAQAKSDGKAADFDSNTIRNSKKKQTKTR